jgi:hypothetical protein
VVLDGQTHAVDHEALAPVLIDNFRPLSSAPRRGNDG